MPTIDWNAPVQTEDGRKVKFYTKTANDLEHPIHGVIIQPDDSEVLCCWDMEGKTWLVKKATWSMAANIINVPKRDGFFFFMNPTRKPLLTKVFYKDLFGKD